MNSANPQAIRQARAARTRTLRRRAIAGAVALFVATWVWIAVVLIAGRDPALASHVTTAAQVSSSSSSGSSSKNPVTSTSGSTGSTGTTGSTGSTGSTGTTGSTGSATSQAPTSVTTQQS